MLIGAWKFISGIKTVPSPHVRPAKTPDVTLTVTVGSGLKSTPSFSSSTKPEECWQRAATAVSIAGRNIAGGLLYVGRGLPAVAGHAVEPALVDPSLPVGRRADIAGSAMGYWPSYSQIPPECRAAYLDWLAQGRRNPSAYIGYVFLYFYGLERRILSDASSSPDARSEFATIHGELDELLGVYGAVRENWRQRRASGTEHAAAPGERPLTHDRRSRVSGQDVSSRG